MGLELLEGGGGGGSGRGGGGGFVPENAVLRVDPSEGARDENQVICMCCVLEEEIPSANCTPLINISLPARNV